MFHAGVKGPTTVQGVWVFHVHGVRGEKSKIHSLIGGGWALKSLLPSFFTYCNTCIFMLMIHLALQEMSRFIETFW